MHRVPYEPMSLQCPICHETGFKNLVGHIFSHGMTVDEFREKTGYTGRLVTASQARLMNARSREAFWSDPTASERHSTSIKASYTPELRERRSLDAYKQWETRDRGELSNKISDARANATDEQRESRRERIMDYWSENRSPMSALRIALRQRANNCCEKCGKTEQQNIEQTGRRLHLHHLNYDRVFAKLEDVQLLCSHCHHSLHGDGNERERYPMVARITGELLKALRVDVQDENFIETPRRVAEFLLEHFPNGAEFEEELESFNEAVFPSAYDGMVIQNVSAIGMCPHHLLPVLYEGVVAYLPDQLTIGLSKLSRIAQLCLKGALMQESGTLLVADTMSDILRTEDVGVMLHGRHTCMMLRGVKLPNSFTQTSELRGLFREDAKVRAEFMTFVGLALRKINL